MSNDRNHRSKAERGVAHIIRRPLVPKDEGASANGGARAGPRAPHTTSVAEDSAEILLTPPSYRGFPGPAGKEGRLGGERTGTLDELTVEDPAQVGPPLSLIRERAIGTGPVAEPPPESASPEEGALVVIDGNDRGRLFALKSRRMTIGRGVDNDIVLTDISVSRHHLILDFDGQDYVVNDIGSGNGTLINGDEVEDRQTLRHGDHLELGQTFLRYDAPLGSFDAIAKQESLRKAPPPIPPPVPRHPPLDAPLSLDDLDDDDSQTVAAHGRASGARPSEGWNAGPPQDPPRMDPRDEPANIMHSADAAMAALEEESRGGPIAPTVLPSVHHAPSGNLPEMPVPPTPSPAIPYPIQGSAGGGPIATFGPPDPDAPPQPPRPTSSGAGWPAGHAAPAAPMGLDDAYPSDPYAPSIDPYAQPADPYGGSVDRYGGSVDPYGGPGPAMAYEFEQAGSAPPVRPGWGQPQGREDPPRGPEQPRFAQPAAPPQERARLLIAIISVALVLVGVGIIFAIKGDEEEPVARTDTDEPGIEVVASSNAGATGSASAPPAAAAGHIPPSLPTGAGDAPEVDPGDEPAEAEAEAAASEDAGDEGEEAATDPGTQVARVSASAAPDGPRAAITLASLTSGTRSMPTTTWGTDESFLRSMPAKDSPSAAEIALREADRSSDGRDDADRDESREERPRRESRPRRSESSPRRESRPERDDAPRRSGGGGVARARSTAEDLYKSSEFAKAAETLRDAADAQDDEKVADELYDIADSYGQVGKLLAVADRAQRTDAPAALKAYKKALSMDRSAGGGAHTDLLKLRIGKVAPIAARTYMARKRYADAKSAAEDAAQYGAADEVRGVRGSLESRAEKALRKALNLVDDGDMGEAERLLREILEYAPTSSHAYSDARKELKRL